MHLHKTSNKHEFMACQSFLEDTNGQMFRICATGNCGKSGVSNFTERIPEPLTCFSLLLLPNAVHIRVNRNNSHTVDRVRVQVPQSGAGGAPRHLLLFIRKLKALSVKEEDFSGLLKSTSPAWLPFAPLLPLLACRRACSCARFLPLDPIEPSGC